MTHPLDLHQGDPVRVTLPANGTRAGMVEAVTEDGVRVWFPNEAGGFAVTVPPANVEVAE